MMHHDYLHFVPKPGELVTCKRMHLQIEKPVVAPIKNDPTNHIGSLGHYLLAHSSLPFHDTLCSIHDLSATMAMNSEFVGFALLILMVYPNRWEMLSMLPRVHATSIAWRMARSTRLGVVLYFSAIAGYSVFVIAPRISILLYTIVIASRKY